MTFKFNVRTMLATATLATVAALSACGGGTNPRDASLRLLNLSSAYPSLDLYVDGVREISAQASGSVSGSLSLDDEAHDLALRGAGGAANLSPSSPTLARSTGYTLVAYDSQNAVLSVLLADDDEDNAPAADASRLRVLQAAPDAGSLDVHLSNACPDVASFTGTTLIGTGLAGGALGSFVAGGTGTVCVRVTGNGNTADLRLAIPALPLAGGQTVTLVLTAAAGGVLVDATRLVQGGAATVQANTNARVRLAAGVQGNGQVGVTLAGAAVATGSRSPVLGTYALVPAGAGLAPTLTVNGSTVATPALTLAAGADYTLLVAGSAAAPTVQLLPDNNRAASQATQAKIRLVHGAASLPDDTLSLTVDSAALASGVSWGTASAYANFTAGSDRVLAVAANTVPVVYSDTAFKAEAGAVYSVLALGGNAAPTVLVRKDR